MRHYEGDGFPVQLFGHLGDSFRVHPPTPQILVGHISVQFFPLAKALAIIRGVAIRIVLDPRERHDFARLMAMDADFGDREEPSTPAYEPFRKVGQVEGPRRILGELRSAR